MDSEQRASGPRGDERRLAVLEAVAEAMSDAAFGVDLDGTVTSWTRSAERIFGWSHAETIGQSVHRLFRSDDTETVDRFLSTVANGAAVDRYEIDIDRKGGVHTPIALSLHPAIDRSTGAVIALAAVAHDITEQRIAQATMAELEARVQMGESSAHIGRWLWDVASGAVQWSIEAHRIHGVDPLDFGGDLDSMLAFVAAEDRPALEAAIERAVDDRRPFEQEYDIVRTDGTRCRVHSRAEPAVGENGAVVGLRGILTER